MPWLTGRTQANTSCVIGQVITFYLYLVMALTHVMGPKLTPLYRGHAKRNESPSPSPNLEPQKRANHTDWASKTMHTLSESFEQSVEKKQKNN